MSKKVRLFLPLVLVGLLFVLVLARCGGSGIERVWLKAPDWRRAQRVGQNQLNDPVPLVVDGDGTIYLLRIASSDGASRPTVVALNRRLEPLWEQSVAVELVQPDVPQLLWDGRQLHLFWLDRNSLYSARISPDGELLAGAQLLSAGHTAESFTATVDPDGEVVVWYGGSRRDPGLYQAQLDDRAEPILLDPLGLRPALSFNRAGTLFAAWAYYPTGFGQPAFFYAAYEGGQYRPQQERLVAEPLLSPTSILLGPYLGLDQERVYLFWTIAVRTGPSAGSADSRYVVVTPGDPAVVSEPLPLRGPLEHDLPYEDWPDTGLRVGSRVSWNSDLGRSGSFVDMFVNPIVESELALTYSGQLAHLWNKSATQVNLMYFGGGGQSSYQLLSFSSAASTAPAVTSDSDRYLYATWLEPGESGFIIYLSSTAPDIQDVLGSVTAYDIRRLAGETGFGLISGAVLAPLAGLLWLILPLVVLGLTSFLRRGDQKITSPGTLVSLGLSVAAYLVVKFGTLPGAFDYAPFSAWLPLPDWLQGILLILVPVSITLFSLWLAWHYTFRRKEQSPFYFLLIFGAADAVLSMAVYGVLIYGAL